MPVINEEGVSSGLCHNSTATTNPGSSVSIRPRILMRHEVGVFRIFPTDHLSIVVTTQSQERHKADPRRNRPHRAIRKGELHDVKRVQTSEGFPGDSLALGAVSAI